MARTKTYDRVDLLHRAMERFWRHGYHASSIDDLVTATGVSRHGLYAEFSDKRGLFLAAARHYIDAVVSPAFHPVEAPGAGLAAIRGYFVRQIEAAALLGLPGPGCLLANAMTELAPHDAEVRALVAAHLGRLESGFANALGAFGDRTGSDFDAGRQARLLASFAQGLWSVSRVATDPQSLKDQIEAILEPMEGDHVR